METRVISKRAQCKLNRKIMSMTEFVLGDNVRHGDLSDRDLRAHDLGLVMVQFHQMEHAMWVFLSGFQLGFFGKFMDDASPFLVLMTTYLPRYSCSNRSLYCSL